MAADDRGQQQRPTPADEQAAVAQGLHPVERVGGFEDGLGVLDGERPGEDGAPGEQGPAGVVERAPLGVEAVAQRAPGGGGGVHERAGALGERAVEAGDEAGGREGVEAPGEQDQRQRVAADPVDERGDGGVVGRRRVGHAERGGGLGEDPGGGLGRERLDLDDVLPGVQVAAADGDDALAGRGVERGGARVDDPHAGRGPVGEGDPHGVGLADAGRADDGQPRAVAREPAPDGVRGVGREGGFGRVVHGRSTNGAAAEVKGGASGPSAG
ncbi:MAG: hypothetical protein R3F65_32965 [bacterium]